MTANITWIGMQLLVLAGLALMIINRKLIYAFCGMLVSLSALAGNYFLAGAEFIAGAQLLVYVGGILVLLAFGLMLSDRDRYLEPLNQSANRLVNGVAFLLSCYLLYQFILRFVATVSLPAPSINSGKEQTQSIGQHLMTTHYLPLEIIGIILLVALIAALVVVSPKAEENGQD